VPHVRHFGIEITKKHHALGVHTATIAQDAQLIALHDDHEIPALHNITGNAARAVRVERHAATLSGFARGGRRARFVSGEPSACHLDAKLPELRTRDDFGERTAAHVAVAYEQHARRPRSRFDAAHELATPGAEERQVQAMTRHPDQSPRDAQKLSHHSPSSREKYA
jgi:hypothetical protein